LPNPGKEFEQHPIEAGQCISISNNQQSLSVEELVAKFPTKYPLPGSVVTVHGWVQNRRRFINNITVLELVNHWEYSAAEDVFEDVSKHTELWNRRLKCVLHPNCTVSDCGVMGQILAPGSQVRLQGFCAMQKDSTTSMPVLWISRVALLRSSWRPNIVRHLIELVVQNEFPLREARDALNLSDTDMEEILQMKDLTSRQWRAAEISCNLQDSQSRVAVVPAEMMSMLGEFESLRLRYPVQSVVFHDVRREENASREGSRWKRKKEPQLIWMAQQVKEALHSHPDFGKRPLRVLDVGGGKGYLANHLASELGDNIKIQVIDIAQGAVKNGAMRSKRLQLPVKYTVGDASTANFRGTVDLVVALHACGALTDVAMGHAVASNAGFVICPCCFRSNALLKVSSYTAGASMQRLQAEDWLAVSPSQYDSLKLLAEIQGDISLANEAIHTICALRASNLEARAEGHLSVSIKSFPVAFSSRNFCMVGRLNNPTSSTCHPNLGRAIGE